MSVALEGFFPAETTKLRVLVLDDDREIGQLFSAMLPRLGAEPYIASSAQDFFQKLKYSKPDIVILDLIMPGLDGLDIIRKMQGRCKAEIVIISGAGKKILQSVRRSATSKGLNVIGELLKPFHVDDVKTVLSRSRPATSQKLFGITSNSQPTHSREDLKLAIERQEIVAFFQPKITALSRKLVGFEALARWRHPSLGLLPPSNFLGPIEDFELDCEFTLSIFKQACNLLLEHRDKSFNVAVNVSGILWNNREFTDGIRELTREYGLPPNRFVLEVLESDKFDLLDSDRVQLTRLSMQGFKLAIDDFGAAHSSFDRLLKIPFDELKIDQSYVRSATGSPRGRQIIEAIAQFAKTMDLDITAEGVEDQSVFEMIKEIGDVGVQGYYLSRPMEPEKVSCFIEMQMRQQTCTENGSTDD